MQSIKSASFELELLLSLKWLEPIKRGGAQKADGIAPEEAPKSGHIVFTSNVSRVLETLAMPVAALITTDKCWRSVAEKQTVCTETWIFTTPAVGLAMTQVLPYFDLRHSYRQSGIHPQSAIHPSAQIGPGVSIGPFVSIGADCVIGENCVLEASVSIGCGVQIGSGTHLHSGVAIADFCKIGARVEVHSNTTIGSDGFGYAEDPVQKGRFLKIPQIGIVVVEDDVEIGANCAIDRATVAETRIGRGAKLDNLIHIAHNCQLGADSRLAGGTMLAGSVKTGTHLLTGGGVMITDHVTVTNHVALAGRAGVTKDISVSGAYGGYPLEPLRDSLKSLANIAKLTTMRRQLTQIRKHLGLETPNES